MGKDENYWIKFQPRKDTILKCAKFSVVILIQILIFQEYPVSIKNECFCKLAYWTSKMSFMKQHGEYYKWAVTGEITVIRYLCIN